MKIGILMMMANKEPSLRNAEAFKEYVIKDYVNLKNSNKLENDYKFIFYYGDNLSETSIYKIDDNITYIHTCNDDDIYSTYEKTIEAFKKLDEIDNFDYIVRINISMFLNIRLLDKIAKSLDPNIIYCNAINAVLDQVYTNTIYPRGDLYIMSTDMIRKIINKSDIFYINRKNPEDYNKQFKLKIDHVDDLLLGCTLKEALGDDYFKHIKMIYYNLIMKSIQEDEDISNMLNKHIIGTRLKTTPPGELSGYSWDDNDYRLNDILKFKKCYEYFFQFEYEKGLTINHLLVDESNSRPLTAVNYISCSVKDIKDYLNKKGA